MQPLTRLLPVTAAGVVFAAAVLDVSRDFAFLSPMLAWAATLACLPLLVAMLRSRRGPGAVLGALLTFGALATFLVRNIGYQPTASRSESDWELALTARSETLAREASVSFANLCADARSAARALARATPVALATEGSDAEDYLSGAFDELARYPYPRALPAAVPGATLYDAWRRPLAWTGENIPLHAALEKPYGAPPSSLFILEQGVYTYLVALEPLLSGLGFVSVEIPLIADRRLDNRYLKDYDVFSSWLARSAETELVPFGSDGSRLERLFDEHDEQFWTSTDASRRLSFALRADDGTLLGVSSLLGDTAGNARQRARQSFRNASGFVLLATITLVLGLLLLGRSHLWACLFFLWVARLVPFWTNVPLSFGLGLDDPGHYASSFLFGLARSPVDFFLTAATLLLSVMLLADRAIPRATGTSKRRLSGHMMMALTSLSALAVLSAANVLILDAWSNSNLALASIRALPIDYPRVVVQLGFVMFFLASSLTALVLVSRPTRVRPELTCVIDAVVITASYTLASELGQQEFLLLALPPFVIARALALGREGLTERWSRGRIYTRLAMVGVLMLLSVSAFYPALARFEDTTAQAFVERIVAPAVLQHSHAELNTLADTARAIDVMAGDGRLDALDREDVTYRLWVGTELATSSLSSSVEILDEQFRTVSKFSLNLPSFDSELPRAHAPDEWIYENEPHPADSNHPGFVLARRGLPGPDGERWEIRIRLAADWRNLVFDSTTHPYLHLFRTAGADVPFRLPYRELALFVHALDGSAIFQSRGGAIRLNDADLQAARRIPLWRDYTVFGQAHRAFLFSDGPRTFVLSYPRSGLLRYAAELVSWGVLTAIFALAMLAISLTAGVIGSPAGVQPSELWTGIGGSFSGKLYVAFVLIALVPIASLAFLIRGIVIQQLQRDIERDGMGRAQVVERLVKDAITDAAPSEGSPAVTDAVLESVGTLAGVDVDLYSSGELVATSKPELVGSGLLRARAVPSAFRDLVLGSATDSIHRQAVGAFEYLVVSVPIRLDSQPEPGILALPLASQQNEIDVRVSSLNQTLLLAALAFSIAAAALAYSLARRISDPINTLTEATHRIAGGDFDVSLETRARDEIGALFASFTQMTADLKQQRLDLEHQKKLEAWAEMARQVAHEVKNPLTPIQLSTEHMLRVFRDPKVDFEPVLQDCSETILQQVKALRQISMEFSTFASPEPLKLDVVDISEIVSETVSPYVQSPPDGVSVTLAVSGPIPKVAADSRLLKRTVLNLVENALHALNAGGRVDVAVNLCPLDPKRFVEVSVTDTGVGVDPELKERIFEPYFSTRAAGTGLGLAIAKKVVEDHGGTISLESELGTGTSVRMRLPVERSV